VSFPGETSEEARARESEQEHLRESESEMQFFVCWENLLIFVFVLPLAAGCWLYFDFYFVSSLFDSVVVSFRLLAQKKQC